MKLLAFLCSVLLLLPLTLAAAEKQSPGAGHWEGDISLPGTKLPIRVDLESTAGAWAGTIDIPLQGLRGYQLGSVSVAGTKVRFALPNVPGDPAFSGQLSADGQKLTGDFNQAGQAFPFALERKAKGADGAGEKGIPGHGFPGFWQGALKVTPLVELRLGLEISKDKEGHLKGTIISIDQGGSRNALSSASEKAGKVEFKIDDIGGAFEGVLSADGSQLSGEWQQGGQKLPLIFRRQAKTAGLKRPQEPKRPYPYTEQEVVVDHAAAKVKLAATLTLPAGPGPHPAVVFITGSGPQDRDEAIMGHRPFLVLADHLTRAGIAVLRYDDRGIGRSTGDFGKATHTDFVEDALAALDWLKSRKEIDPKRIGLLGHSEGGIEAPLAAVKRPDDIAFIVLLAGVGVPMQDLLIRQGEDMARVMGRSEADVAKWSASQRKWYPRLQAASDSASAEKIMHEVIEKEVAEYSPEQRKAMGLTEEMLAGQAKMAASPWFRQIAAYDPRPTLRQVKCPVLAINGEKDLQVAAKDNLSAIRDSLAAGGNQKVTIIELPGLNHLFQHCTTGAVAEYGEIEETLAPAALDAVSSWIREQAGL